jgi:hypothetical protein
MANSNTFVEGFNSGGDQVTTLSQVQGAGLAIPSANFINIRAPGKIEALFSNNGNAEKLYSVNKPQDVGLADALKNRYDYKNPNQGQRSRTTSMVGLAAQDANLVRKFLGSNKGFRFIGKQLILQGYQAFDETKVYNPASPLIAAIKPASFGLLDRPTRHLDTSNIVGGLVNGLGLGSVVSGVGALLGGSPPSPPPPRSSVASTASRPDGFLGITTSTFSSLIGGGDRSDQVVTSIARNDIKDLLRGNTATTAYNAPRYNRWLSSSSSKGFFSNLLTAAGKFIQNNTLVGGILPPKQPWAANYRADEKTYDLMLNAGKLFAPSSTGIGGGGILSGLLNSIGFGRKADYSQAVQQRFYRKSDNAPNPTRLVIIRNGYRGYTKSVITSVTTEVGSYDGSAPFMPSKIVPEKIKNYINDNSLQYGGTIAAGVVAERSDQLLNYKTLIDDDAKNFEDQFSNPEAQRVKNIVSDLNKALKNITGDNNAKYSLGADATSNMYPLQFAKFNTDKIGLGQIVEINPQQKNQPTDKTYQGRWRKDQENKKRVPTRLGTSVNDRFIRPTNNVDFVNSLEVMNPAVFETAYSLTDTHGVYGPDIIKFYFYDIINKKYIPFNATVKSLTDNNQAQWEPVEYLGRPDKLYYYKGFTRSVSFNFSVVAHSIKELMPMWQRINYLVGLTRPANYTLQQYGGFMVSPMVQLTLGDFYKNHNVVINSCNVTVPEDASWETIPEDAKEAWYFGPNGAINWSNDGTQLGSGIDNGRGNSQGRVAQFPRVAEIQIEMNVLEKDRPKTGRAIWGDAPVLRASTATIKELPTINGVPITQFGAIDVEYTSKVQDDVSMNDFSTNIRYDNDAVGVKVKTQ